MIGSQEQFTKSRLTQQIDDFIKQTKPTREMQIDAFKVAEKMGIQSPDYRSVQPVKSYLDSLVRKKLLTMYGSNQAMSVMNVIYYIDQPHQQSYWENKR